MSVNVSHSDEHGIVLTIEPGVMGAGDPGCWVRLSARGAQGLANDLSHALIASGVMRGSTHRPVPCAGQKRAFMSEGAARAAHMTAGFRVRIYRCPNCDQFHAANADKAGSHA